MTEDNTLAHAISLSIDVGLTLDNGSVVRPTFSVDAGIFREALKEAGLVVEQDWQPIETAPKDGTWLLAIVEGWRRPENKPFIPAVVMWAWCPKTDKECWVAPDNDWGTETELAALFTHWRPLPAPPAATGGDHD